VQILLAAAEGRRLALVVSTAITCPPRPARKDTMEPGEVLEGWRWKRGMTFRRTTNPCAREDQQTFAPESSSRSRVASIASSTWCPRRSRYFHQPATLPWELKTSSKGHPPTTRSPARRCRATSDGAY